MKTKDILKDYKRLAKTEDQQLNVATFINMYSELKDSLKGKSSELDKLTEIYGNYMSMRDGCEINNKTIENAISEIESAIFTSHKK